MTDTSCDFCTMPKWEWIAENDLAYAMLDHFPVNPGHALVIPKRHFQSLFEATDEEAEAIWHLLKEVKKILEERFHPDAFNVGVNVGPEAGQTIMHLHVHVIPRYYGDVENPRGGIRRVKTPLVPYCED